jgi:hypothetical protein
MAFKDLATQKHDSPAPEQREAKAIHIFVDTDFKRSDAPDTSIFALMGCERFRYIRKLEYLINKSFREQTDEISQIIRDHYAQNEGKLPLWGEIKRYHFRYKADCPAIVFDTNGNIIGESFLAEGHTTLLIGGEK